MDDLKHLEAEAIYILREVAGQCRRPVFLFSGGKDSLVLMRLAEKAYRPKSFPGPILHIDTGCNFAETIAFRDETVRRLGERLLVRAVAADSGAGGLSLNRLQARTLIETIAEFKFDLAVGGARRDEEKSRAKERIFSLRGPSGGWNPGGQRPEVWKYLNGHVGPGSHLRVFPMSDWTELDVWRYIKRESLELPPLYFSHRRKCFFREGLLLPECESLKPGIGETSVERRVRFRTLGDMTCSAAVISEADDIDSVIDEIEKSPAAERAGRADDRFSPWALEERKREGYF